MSKYFSVLLFAFLLFTNLYAQDVLPKPDKYYSVVDDASLLKVYEHTALTQKLDNFKKKTSIELVVVIIKSLGETTVEDYANKLFNNWGIGQKEQNNGILLLIAINDRKMRIETGYGIEDKLTDADAANIIDAELAPYFKNSLYYKGIDKATTVIISKLNTDLNTYKYITKTIDECLDIPSYIVFIFVLFAQLIVGLIVFRYSNKSKMIQEKYNTNGILIRIFIIFLILGFLFVIVSKSYNYSGKNLLFIFSFLVSCFYYQSYLFSKSLVIDLIRTVVSLFYGSLASIVLYLVTQIVLFKFGIFYFGLFMTYVFICLAILLSALLFYLFKTKKLNLSTFIPSGGGSSGGSGGSGGGGYGGGSSGGGGASGSW
jgi:uncharacterized protein